MASLKTFQKLSSTSTQDRVDAISDILEAFKNPDTKEEDVDYTISRLCRGLMSSAEAARQGSATALAQILSSCPNITTETMIEYFKKIIRKAKASNRQQKRDYIFGRIFSLLVVCKGGRANELDDKSLSTYTNEMVYNSKKVLLREICIESLCVLVQHISYDKFLSVMWPLIKEMYGDDEKLSDYSPEMVALGLVVNQQARESGEKPPVKMFKRILKAKNLSDLGLSLGESTRAIPNIHMVWAHIIEEFRLQAEQQEELLEAGAPPVWVDFWNQIIENDFFQSNHNKKYIGFRIFEKFLEEIDGDHSQYARFLFTKNFMRNLILAAQKKDMKLHKCAHHCLRVIKRIGSEDSRVALAIVAQILGPEGDREFDVRSRTTTVKDLLSTLDDECMTEYLQSIVKAFDNASEQTGQTVADEEDDDTATASSNAATTIRIWAINQIYAVSKLPKLPLTQTTRNFVIQFLVKNSFFSVLETDDDSSMAENVHQTCRNRLMSLVSDMLSTETNASASKGQQEEGDDKEDEDSDKKSKKSKKSKSKSSSNEIQWSVELVHQAFTDCLEDDTLECHLSLDDEFLSSRKAMLKTVKLIKKARAKVSEKEQIHLYDAFSLLLLHLGVLQFWEEDAEEATDLLLDVQESYKKAFSTGRKSRSNDNEEDGPHYTEVITDILMSLLVKPSSLMRDLSTSVFKRMLPYISAGVIQTLTEVLIKDFKDDDEEDDEDMMDIEDDSDEDMNMDVEEQENGDVDPSAAAMLFKALKNRSQSESDDEEEDEEEEEKDEEDDGSSFIIEETMSDMEENAVDDEVQKEMDMYDRHLANMIKLRQEKIQGKKESKRQTLHFRLRVLDLVEIILKHRPDCPNLCSLVPAILELIKVANAMSPHSSRFVAADRRAVVERASGIFSKRLCRITKFSDTMDAEYITDLIEKLTEQALRCSESQRLSLLSAGLLFLCKAMMSLQSEVPAPATESKASKKKTPKKKKSKKADASALSTEDALSLTVGERNVVGIYGKLLEAFVTKKNCLNTRFLLDFFNKFPLLGWCLCERICSVVLEARTEFLVAEAFGLLGQIASHRGALMSRISDQQELRDFFLRFCPALSEAVVKSLEGKVAKPAKLKKCLSSAASVYNAVSKCFGSDDEALVRDLLNTDSVVSAMSAYANDSDNHTVFESQMKTAMIALGRSINALDQLGEKFEKKQKKQNKRSREDNSEEDSSKSTANAKKVKQTSDSSKPTTKKKKNRS